MSSSTSCSRSRLIAWQILKRSHDADRWATEVLPEALESCNLERRDRDFVTLLVRGTVTYQILIDKIIEESCTPKTKMSAGVKIALRLATFEMKVLDKPPAVCINEYVNLTRQKMRSASGLANAILHKVSENDTYESLLKADDGDLISDDLSLKYSQQAWLVDYLIDSLGLDEALDFMRLSLREAKASFVLNSLKDTGIENSEVLDSFEATKQARRGNIVQADESSIAISREIASRLETGCKFLEVGCGNGTKTALLHIFARESGVDFAKYDALDVTQAKLDVLQKRAESLGFSVDSAILGDASDIELDDKYDVIFIDAPCTGLGTLRRHPEIRGRVSKQSIDFYAELGLKILENTSRFLRDGGFLFFATCTIAKEENMGTVNKFLDSDAGSSFRLERILREPHLTKTSDAHFCVELLRTCVSNEGL